MDTKPFPVQMNFLEAKARPFLKWAGGKTQLLEQFTPFFPKNLLEGNIKRYIEPFVGGGAVFFAIAGSYPLDDYLIVDVNPELILAYKTIKQDVKSLISHLSKIESDFLSLNNDGRKTFFYNIRQNFNDQLSIIDFSTFSESWIERTANIIFLNRTCFNGLFRVNSKGEFNVPFGKYKNPTICDSKNLVAVSQVLQDVTIQCGDFSIIESHVNSQTFVYFDPPYRPLSATSSFTSYSRGNFNDSEQLRLASFYRLLDRKGVKLMLSNSDPKNLNPKDNFFEDAYEGFNIHRVKASRMINSKADGRGQLSELLILNY
jgi:DNA adenine methylase